MLCKLVLRILPIQLIQAAVTANFCKDRGRRDRCGFGIALDKRAFGDRQTRRAVAVDQREIRPPMQTVKRPAHGEKGRLQNIDFIDLPLCCHSDGIIRCTGGDLIKKQLAFFLAELFGIIQPCDCLLYTSRCV